MEVVPLESEVEVKQGRSMKTGVKGAQKNGVWRTAAAAESSAVGGERTCRCPKTERAVETMVLLAGLLVTKYSLNDLEKTEKDKIT